MLRLPTSPLAGVPEKVPVAGLKLSQLGNAEPSASVALSVRVSPSGSVKVPAGTVKFRLPSCAMLWTGIGVATTGASLMLVTVRLNVVLTEASPSLAVTLMLRLPTSPLAGVPEKVPVAGLKLSQLGNAEPLASVALSVRVSPSGSVKVPTGTVKFRLPSCAMLCAGIGAATTGASFGGLMVRPKVVLVEASPSLAVTLMLRVPISPLAGVPEKVPVAGLKLSQLGSAEPSACVALSVSVSPSGSLKVLPGTVKLSALPCAIVCAGIGVASTGASLTLVIVRLKAVLTEASPSLAVTLMLRLPTSPLAGVPEKVPVAVLKLSQLGSAEPSASVALYVRVSPSGSVKVPEGTVKFSALSCATLCAGIGVASTGASLTLVMVSVKVVLTEASPSFAITLILRLPTSLLPGVPEKVPVAVLNVNQLGRGEPFARVALNVRVSPSGSVKVPAGTVKFSALSCATLCVGIVADTTGALLTLETVRVKVVLMAVRLGSVAVILIDRLPTSALPGVPEKVPVEVLNVSQLGSAEPSARVAVNVRVSPSGSVKVPAGTVKLSALSCATLCAGMVVDTTGASLMLVTVKLNVVLTLALVVSVAVTLIERTPTSALPGVPEKVPVAELKVSQLGSGEPLAKVALSVNASSSGSVNVPAGTVKFRLPFCVMFCAGMGVDTTGGLPVTIVRVEVALLLVSSLAVTEMVRLPAVGVVAALT